MSRRIADRIGGWWAYSRYRRLMRRRRDLLALGVPPERMLVPKDPRDRGQTARGWCLVPRPAEAKAGI